MRGNKSVILITIDLDPVPGFGNNPIDHLNAIRMGVLNSLGHYNPTVKLLGVENAEKEPNVTFVQSDDIQPDNIYDLVEKKMAGLFPKVNKVGV